MLNIEKYKDKINSGIDFCDLFYDISLIKHGKYSSCDGKCKKCCDECIKWLAEEYKESILDDVEKEYLSAVIRPFRKEVATISKFHTWANDAHYIYIEMKDKRGCTLPFFPKNTMYKSMEVGRHYSLKELGL